MMQAGRRHKMKAMVWIAPRTKEMLRNPCNPCNLCNLWFSSEIGKPVHSVHSVVL